MIIDCVFVSLLKDIEDENNDFHIISNETSKLICGCFVKCSFDEGEDISIFDVMIYSYIFMFLSCYRDN